MKKNGFSGEGGARGVDGWACRRQTHMVKEVRVQIMSLASSREFQRQDEDRLMWVRGKVFSGEAFTGR